MSGRGAACFITVSLLLSFAFGCSAAAAQLSDFVSKYERAQVHYFGGEGKSGLGRRRREEHEVRLTIQTESRTEFLVHLLPNDRVFGPNVKAFGVGKNGKEEIAFDRRQFKVGRVEGIAGSRAHGHWDPRTGFNGVIRLSNETLYIEPAAKYFPHEISSHLNSVVYKESDVFYNESKSFCPHHLLDKLKESVQPLTRKRRSKQAYRFDPEFNTCPVFVVADHLFYSGPGDLNEPRTIAEMTYHIEQANEMFRDTEFSSEMKNIGFRIDKILIYKDGANPDNPFMGDFGVDELLDTFSEMDFSEYCLGHLFTYRDFDSGVIGLAWVGGTGRGSGGVCEQDRVRTNQGERSLNTGLTSLLNYGRLVPRSVSAITTTHELGHNFGSPHDQGAECAPGGTSGNYIMFASATDGSEDNNRKFSPCSRDSMASVISAKWSLDCFAQENRAPQCGNGVIEEGEECDCGSSSPDQCFAVDPCCTPGNCTLRDGALCSPLVKPCCSNSCVYTTTICRLEEECLAASSCNGTSGDCPSSQPKPNNETCNNGANFCENGECTGSICSRWNAQTCQCAQASQACHVCCIWDEGVCESTEDHPGVNLTLIRPGTTCLDLTGYCTQEGICKVVDNQTPLDDLKNILNKINFGDIADWLKGNWYIAVAGFAGLVVFLVIVHFTYRRQHPEHFETGKERAPLLPEEH